jgi:hypothetical protein
MLSFSCRFAVTNWLPKSAANWASLVHLFWLRHRELEKLPRKKVVRALSAGMQPTDFRLWPELPALVFALAGRVRDFLRKPKKKKDTVGWEGAWV